MKPAAVAAPNAPMMTAAQLQAYMMELEAVAAQMEKLIIAAREGGQGEDSQDKGVQMAFLNITGNTQIGLKQKSSRCGYLLLLGKGGEGKMGWCTPKPCAQDRDP